MSNQQNSEIDTAIDEKTEEGLVRTEEVVAEPVETTDPSTDTTMAETDALLRVNGATAEETDERDLAEDGPRRDLSAEDDAAHHSIAVAVFTCFGIGQLVSWNCILSALPFFDLNAFPRLPWVFASSQSYTTSSLIGQVLMVALHANPPAPPAPIEVSPSLFRHVVNTSHHKVKLLCASFGERILSPAFRLVMSLTVLAAGTVGLALAAVWGYQRVIGFVVALACVAVIGLASAAAQATTFGIAGLLPGSYTVALMFGQGIAGMATFILATLFKLLLPQTEGGNMLSFFVFFALCSSWIVFCIFAYFMLLRLPFFVQVLNDLKSSQSPLITETATEVDHEDDEIDIAVMNSESAALLESSCEPSPLYQRKRERVTGDGGMLPTGTTETATPSPSQGEGPGAASACSSPDMIDGSRREATDGPLPTDLSPGVDEIPPSVPPDSPFPGDTPEINGRRAGRRGRWRRGTSPAVPPGKSVRTVLGERRPVRDIFWSAFPQALNVFLVFAVTFTIFPSVSGTWEVGRGSRLANDWFKLIVVGFFQLGDLVGRYMPNWGMKVPPHHLNKGVAARFVFIPLFMACQRLGDSLIFGSQAFRYLVMLAMALTNGWMASLSMTFAPQQVSSEAEKEVVGFIMCLSLIGGICAGSWLSYATQWGLPLVSGP
ncbi:unnamed protein product [Vitrella brassicaformis CCMP3155]|uniref:Uncharacterized protein n=2 Tax=Vitrella brassicaformis TaxID=1169539 RepID=A0A0G4FWQ0_VITBC|nr:unnamed protein product [Vitrella brassicaformis CCMP3155]|mmetsp:Transcript_119/g.398  ORF Transcript_119/g.398 Transcript_119/m.398 type:complete len:660 (+) Transcript_119:56-2035(+)|eukprot:CEM19655.1 unnamed protein product [Vitrella brassicaformis CCMP3155]